MRIGLASYRCENKNTEFNINQIERAMREAQGKVELLCFGEAFLQGFDSLCWDFEIDKNIAVSKESETMERLRKMTVQYGMAILFGYIERDGERLYSSCAVIADGTIVHNYRRISRGWKEFTRTDEHYCEGTVTGEFRLQEQDFMVSLCGDLWDFPERFRTGHTLLWPVYVNYSKEEWEGGAIEEYAAQAVLAAGETLMVNPLDNDPVNHGGSFCFRNGTVAARLPFDTEGVLIVTTE
jgi:N-carbamoylputrescine amidase